MLPLSFLLVCFGFVLGLLPLKLFSATLRSLSSALLRRALGPQAAKEGRAAKPLPPLLGPMRQRCGEFQNGWELTRSDKKGESFGMFQSWCFQSYFLLCYTFKFVEQHWLFGLFRQAGLLCASRTQVALDSGDPQRAEGWIQRSWPQLGRGVWWQVDQPFVFQLIWSTVPDLPSSEVANPSRSSTLRGAGVAPNSNAGIKFWEEGSMGSKTINWSLLNVKMYGASDFFSLGVEHLSSRLSTIVRWKLSAFNVLKARLQ